MIEAIRRQISQEEFDYQTLLDCFKGSAHPRDRITGLLRKGYIVRVKKGLYIFGEDYRRAPYSREVLANLVYGPSYISLDFALHYYGLIPERVESVTSVAYGRSRRFLTPVGLFVYRGINLQAFRIGMDRLELAEGRSFLIAVPEKALADKIHDDRGTGIRTQRELAAYLTDNLRIDQAGLATMDPELIEDVSSRYRSRKIRLLSSFVRRLRRRSREKTDA